MKEVEAIPNPHAGGMAGARPYRVGIAFLRNPISGSAAWFFVIIRKFMFTAIFEIEIPEKNSMAQKNLSLYTKPTVSTISVPASVGVKDENKTLKPDIN